MSDPMTEAAVSAADLVLDQVVHLADAIRIRDEAVRTVQAQYDKYDVTAWHNGYAASSADFEVEALLGLLRKLSAGGFVPDKWDNWQDGDNNYIAITEDELSVLRRLWKGTL